MLLPICFTLATLLPVDFALPDIQGRRHTLNEWRDKPLVVLAFLSADCPVSRLYAERLEELAQEFGPRGVAVIAIDPDAEDSAANLQKLQSELRLTYSFLCDSDQTLARRLGITRTPKVLVLDSSRRIRYQGRVDDQYTPGAHRAKPARRDLAEALRDLLAGRAVRVPHTVATGCPLPPLPKEPEPKTAPGSSRDAVTYHQDLAPIIARRCATCHQAGGIAPFALDKSQDVARRKKAMLEAIADRRMPPWHADPQFGRFANDPSLSDEERRLFSAWQVAGFPMGVPAEATSPPAPEHRDGWSISGPDVIVSIPQPFAVAETGVIPYQYFEVDPGFREDHWIQEAEIRPGNRKVVHHATVFLRPPGSTDLVFQGELQSFCVAAYAMGTPPLILPRGMAKKVPAGWKFVFVIHYVPGGANQFDQTQLGIRFADPRLVQKEVATNILISDNFTIPPRCADHVVSRSRTFEHDVLLLALFPHMHLRGVSFRYEAKYPDGRTETLLFVPRWDMNWQHRYVFAEPKRLPAGTTLTATAHYDNSENNPNNPDPDAEVHAGPQTNDEMFNGYYDFCLADQDLTKSNWPKRLRNPLVFAGAIALLGLLVMLRRMAANRQRP
ncbi:MAG TPA: redoxin domain-containing protein [Gemmataceae bacterium]|jgi:peroxiredoxin|nr:redoxin domain-containing protein [Gemmataceae bacterium]